MTPPITAHQHLAFVPEAEISVATTTAPQPIHQRRDLSKLLHAYVVTDLLAMGIGFLMSLALAELVNSQIIGREATLPLGNFDTVRMAGLAVVATAVLLWFQYKGFYRVRMNFWAEAKATIKIFTAAMLIDGFLQFAAKNDFSRLWLMSGWVFAGIAVLLLRAAHRNRLRQAGKWDVATLLVGNGMTAKDTRAALDSERSLGYRIVASIDNLPAAFLKAGRSWERLVAEYGADYVVIALDGVELDNAGHSIAQLTREDVPFSISPPRRNLPILDMAPQYFFNHDIKLLTYNSGLEQPLPRFIKRAFDIVVSSLMLLMLSPLMLVISLFIKRDGGKVLFGHPRIGKNGTVFNCLKFRSMIANGEQVLQRHLEMNPVARAEWEADQKLKHDPRITTFGAFLRRTSIDELPQFINVLKGEMSLVGPRPIVINEVSKYDRDIAHYYRVSPGITGLWQVSGRNDVTYEQRVQMDSWYVRNWSLWHDVAILCKTVPALLRGSGAY